ncbi:MAG: DUF1640 domain-containing protein [Methylovulum sp.]|uniref:DUF1640 domain-containing protein n=1 Tax=Methylovulum sp. TaxID=1916980 RepID=UPI00260B3511|nr:DUF1640 domain-containing protein [Methylovulum sp.]MDD2725323.1 DUF1640 domain-containing protein [Methylovulum sp.]MDD5126405.1 DUF1640 domain-containing protein [Methylovulum sp.]
MTTLAIDTYALVTKLKEAGVPEQQAAAQVETITQAIDTALEQAKHDYQLDKLVTNKDLDVRIKETELKIELVRSELKRDIAETKAELVRWVVGVGVLQTVLITALVLKLAGTF